MRIRGVANTMPGESPSHLQAEPVEPPSPGKKVKEVSGGNAANNNDSLKQGLARVFEKIKLNQVLPLPPPGVELPPNPYERGDRRKKAVAKYRRTSESEQKSGQKLNKAA